MMDRGWDTAFSFGRPFVPCEAWNLPTRLHGAAIFSRRAERTAHGNAPDTLSLASAVETAAPGTSCGSLCLDKFKPTLP